MEPATVRIWDDAGEGEAGAKIESERVRRRRAELGEPGKQIGVQVHVCERRLAMVVVGA